MTDRLRNKSVYEDNKHKGGRRTGKRKNENENNVCEERQEAREKETDGKIERALRM